MAQDPRHDVDLRKASLSTLPGARVILRKETIYVLPAEPYEEFQDPEDKLQRVKGSPFSASARTAGPLALSITGGALLTTGLLFAGLAIAASRPMESCPENCRLGQAIGQLVGGVGSGVFVFPGLIMFGVGLSQYTAHKSNPKIRMVVY